MNEKTPVCILGLDIGSNSVGSAWVNIESKEVDLSVGVFPAGVEETPEKRGEPLNQVRRMKRGMRTTIERRAVRKRKLRRFLILHRFLPESEMEQAALVEATNPWHLRRDALRRALTEHEFGRVMLHLSQRRGAIGVHVRSDDDGSASKAEGKGKAKDEDGLVKEAIVHTRGILAGRTFGEMMADEFDARVTMISGREGHEVAVREQIRNKGERFEFHADRGMVRDEFLRIWEAQQRFAGPLAARLTDELKRQFDDPTEDDTFRHRGLLFEQRRTTWDLGVLGRCVLEPTDRCVALADRHAQYFRVVESVNNIRITKTGEMERALTPEERANVIAVLRRAKTASVATVRKALGIDKKAVKAFYTLNIERDDERALNTDWFYRSFVSEVIGEERWGTMDERQREAVNRAVLSFDPESEAHVAELRAGVVKWFGLTEEEAAAFVTAWEGRPKLEKRLKLSRRAIANLLPYMEMFDAGQLRWPTQINARQAFAEDGDAKDVFKGAPATPQQRERYGLGTKRLSKADRHFMKKHPDLLPPAPFLANPVVRKAIHEVRRHVIAYLRKYGRKPDRVVIEFARETTQPGKIRNEQLATNRRRDAYRRDIEREVVKPAFGAAFVKLSHNQLRMAVDRVILARQQRWVCPYSEPGQEGGITDALAARGDGLEIDHIVPYSRTGDNGLNNKVLVKRATNRDKGNQTLREWWGSRFETKVARMEWMQKPTKDDLGYFRPRDFGRKWENLNRVVAPGEEWKSSQLTDTAYAAREVQAYLADALYGGAGRPETGGMRRILVTKGQYTAMLRRDWQLFQRLNMNGEDAVAGGVKNRDDHRHHAIDAVVIALTDETLLPRLAKMAAEQTEHYSKTGEHLRRSPIDPPLGMGVAQFRRVVLSRVFDEFDALKDATVDEAAASITPLIVAHRPVNTKLVGHLHKETLYGVVLKPAETAGGGMARDESRATNKIGVARLTPNHLRVPEGWAERQARIMERSTPESVRRALIEECRGMQDPPPGKSGIVRDRALREQLRRCLAQAGHDPESFGKDIAQRLMERCEFRHASGVPIRSVVLLRTNEEPIVIKRRRWDPKTQRMEHDPDVRTLRLYDSQNNHHIEIREGKKGKWSGEVVTAFDATMRVRREKKTAVNREETEAGVFVMSLAQGEMVYMLHPETRLPGYFVVFKIDRPATIHFVQHWDARGASGRRGSDGKPIEGSERDGIPLPPSAMKLLAPPGHQTPVKVRVGPAGVRTVLVGN